MSDILGPTGLPMPRTQKTGTIEQIPKSAIEVLAADDGSFARVMIPSAQESGYIDVPVHGLIDLGLYLAKMGVQIIRDTEAGILAADDEQGAELPDVPATPDVSPDTPPLKIAGQRKPRKK